MVCMPNHGTFPWTARPNLNRRLGQNVVVEGHEDAEQENDERGRAHVAAAGHDERVELPLALPVGEGWGL
jgi:hypothetical protein